MSDTLTELRKHFIAALQHDGLDAQLQYASEHYGDRPDLVARLRAMLKAHHQPGGFLASEAQTHGIPARSEPVGTQIGPYNLLQTIGEGGMGVVYVAEQSHPVQRKVALKIIKPGMDSRQVIGRFEAERQALSLMDHPNIARVLDAGTTDTGRPYFIMELVKGQPITQYCDEKQLTPRQRLELLLPVCLAIQHAHQKGIIHRDIKPSNVLVAEYDQKPLPKVIDFGVAKAVGQPLTEKTMFTGYGQLVGTLEYMSPEQSKVNELDVDTRSDIYSLGVLMYELLIGTTPFDKQRLRSATWDEMLRIIREEEPPKPSTRLSVSKDTLPSVCALRQTEPAKLTKLVRGELDWIVMKALEKNRDRRYATANALASDIGRYLQDEPVQACPPSLGYRLRKFMRRNKAAVVTTVLLVSMLLAVAGTIGWAARNRTALRQQAVQDRATRKAILGKEVGRALDDAAASYKRDKLPEALAEVKRAEGFVAGGEVGPELNEHVRHWRGALTQALRLEEIPLERIVAGQEVIDYQAADTTYQTTFRNYGFDLASESPSAVAQRIRRSVIHDRLIAALDDWWLCKLIGGLEGKEQLLALIQQADTDPMRVGFRDAFDRKDFAALSKFAVDPKMAAQQPATIGLLAEMLGNSRQAPIAVKLLEDAQQRHPTDFWINLSLSQYLRKSQTNRGADAIGFFRVALSQRPDSALMHNAMGVLFFFYRQSAQAEVAFRHALVLAPNNPTTHINLALALVTQGKMSPAIEHYRKGLALQPEHFEGRMNLAMALQAENRPIEALGEYLEVARRQPKESISTALAMSLTRLSMSLKTQKDYEEAEVVFREFIEFRPGDAEGYANLGFVRMGQRKWAEARAALERAVSISPNSAWARSNLAWILANCPDPKFHDLPLALEHARKAVALQPKERLRRNHLGAIQYRAGMWQEALLTLQQAEQMERYPDNYHRIYLVMANWRLDRKVAALKHWVNFVPWMDTTASTLIPLHHEELTNLRIEAELLLGESRDVETAYREILSGEPKAAWARYGLADRLVRSHQWDKSAAEYIIAMAVEEPPDLPTWFAAACSIVRAGNMDEYLRLCERMSRRTGQTRDPQQTVTIAHVCVLAPNALGDSKRVVQLAEQRMALAKGIDIWATHILGLAFYRSGQFHQAVTTLEAGQNEPDLPSEVKISNWLALAMSRQRQGHDREAATAFQSARELLAKEQRDLDRQNLVVQILFRETETLLNKK